MTNTFTFFGSSIKSFKLDLTEEQAKVIVLAIGGNCIATCRLGLITVEKPYIHVGD